MEKCEELVQLLSPFFDAMRSMETQLKCPVCKNLLDHPKLLPCDHIICQNCLPAVHGKQPQCPKCWKFRPKDASSSVFTEEMIEVFNAMDGAISDIFKQFMHDKAPIVDDNGTKAIPLDLKEGCISGSKDPSAGTAESAEGSSEEINTISSDKGSKLRYNLGNYLNSEPDQREINSQPMPVNLSDDKCAFCHSSKTTELYGPIVCYCNGILVKPEEADQERVRYVHQCCLDWAPNVHYSGDNIMNLEEEIERGKKLICNKCGVNGAVLGCSYGACTRRYHVTCALEIDCRWNSENYKMLCPTHAFNIPKLDEFILV